MKKVYSFALCLISCVVIICSGCSDDSCVSGPIQISDLEDFGCTNTALTLSVATLNDFELIRNQEDYDFHIDAKCTPMIDWDAYDLIAGMARLSNGLSSINKDLRMDCSNNKLILSIEIKTNLTTIAPEVSYNALIPKLADDQDISLDVSISSGQ